MIKKLSLICMSCLCILLTGCGEKKLVCNKSETQNGITNKENIEVLFKKEKPISTKVSIKMTFNSNTKSQINTTYDILKTSFEELKDKKGIQINTSKKDNSINFFMNVDLKKINDSEKLGLDFSNNDNYEKIKGEFKSDGYTCE